VIQLLKDFCPQAIYRVFRTLLWRISLKDVSIFMNGTTLMKQMPAKSHFQSRYNALSSIRDKKNALAESEFSVLKLRKKLLANGMIFCSALPSTRSFN